MSINKTANVREQETSHPDKLQALCFAQNSHKHISAHASSDSCKQHETLPSSFNPSHSLSLPKHTGDEPNQGGVGRNGVRTALSSTGRLRRVRKVEGVEHAGEGQSTAAGGVGRKRRHQARLQRLKLGDCSRSH